METVITPISDKDAETQNEWLNDLPKFTQLIMALKPMQIVPTVHTLLTTLLQMISLA